MLYVNFDSAENWPAIFPIEVQRYLLLCLFFGRQQRATVVSDDLTLNCEHPFGAINVANMKCTEHLTVYFLL